MRRKARNWWIAWQQVVASESFRVGLICWASIALILAFSVVMEDWVMWILRFCSSVTSMCETSAITSIDFEWWWLCGDVVIVACLVIVMAAACCFGQMLQMSRFKRLMRLMFEVWLSLTIITLVIGAFCLPSWKVFNISSMWKIPNNVLVWIVLMPYSPCFTISIIGKNKVGD